MTTINCSTNTFSILFADIFFPAKTTETLERKHKFSKFLQNTFPIGLYSISVNEVRGDGNCFLRSLIRFFAFKGICDIPNKDYNVMTFEEQKCVDTAVDVMKTNATMFIRDFIGDSNYEIDSNSPEYQLLCLFSNICLSLKVIVIEYDGYKFENFNKVYQFVPENEEFDDTIILLNFSHHFYLLQPISHDPNIDNNTLRNNLCNQIIMMTS